MWQSATAATIALALQQHLLFGGLGEAIAVIVGGVVSAIALRKATRSAARPAPAPRPAPASPRTAAPPAYGEPAPPTTPDRRLHPGPISLSASTPPPAREDEEAGAPTSLFYPEILAAGPETDANLPPAPPVLRPLGQLSAEWRAQSSSSSSSSSSSLLDPAPHLAHAPVWNHAPFARPASMVRVALDLAPEAGAAIRPPIWRAPIIAAPTAPTEAAEVTSETRAPVWASWLGSTLGSTLDATGAASVERLEAPGDANSASAAQTESQAESVEPTPPIWSSFLRAE